MREPDWVVVLHDVDGNRLHPPAAASAAVDVELALGVTLPDQLRALYLTSDGVFDEPGRWFVIWPLAQLRTRNQDGWAVKSGLHPTMLAFGDDGTGAPFCVPADGGPGVFIWSPIDRSATRLADDVHSFWVAWTTDSRPAH